MTGAALACPVPTAMSSQSTQIDLHPRLPWELTDAIIDHLQSDLSALGVCGMVSSEWLRRSRHHIFTTVQLWPWRIRRFAKLAGSKQCTFSEHIQRIELDDSRVKLCESDYDVVRISI
ncbi:hypothetical protein NMY22_g9324 [Coprinellus aureogranulatus]|nr:hypothetical protein NMY22_g9324 [Coprinellus aureogranulatus]